MIWKHNVGQIGEKLALKFLKNKGYLEVAKNYSKKWGEIDLIVQKNGKLIFVEVKTISKFPKVFAGEKVDYHMPEDHVFPNKLKRIERAITSFLSEKDIDEDVDYQIDVVSVILNKDNLKPLKIDHLENVF